MPVYDSPRRNQNIEHAVGEEEVHEADDREVARKKELANRRRKRTIRRNLIKRDLSLITDLHSGCPQIPTSEDPAEFVNRIKLHAQAILDFNDEISSLIENDAEWGGELSRYLKSPPRRLLPYCHCCRRDSAQPTAKERSAIRGYRSTTDESCCVKSGSTSSSDPRHPIRFRLEWYPQHPRGWLSLEIHARLKPSLSSVHHTSPDSRENMT